MTTTQISVEGMSCNHCVQSIETALQAKEGVQVVKVSLEQNQVEVGFDEKVITLVTIEETIESIGFEVVS